MRHTLTLIACLALSPAAADVAKVIDSQILPGYVAFAASTATLRNTAAADCDTTEVRPAWNAAFDDWMTVSHFRFGPVEQDGRAQTIAFWPDERGATPKALAALIATPLPADMAQVSIAARGLFGLEFLLYDPQFDTADAANCDVLRALSVDLASIAAAIAADWQNGYAKTMRDAGAAGNATYLAPREAVQAIYTATVNGFEVTADDRLQRPMGTFERPRPTRAEAWRSARSQRNVQLSLAALHQTATALADTPIPLTDAALNRAAHLAETLDDPDFAGVADPQGRLKLEILEQAVRAAEDAVVAELGPLLNIDAGFGVGDGD